MKLDPKLVAAVAKAICKAAWLRQHGEKLNDALANDRDFYEAHNAEARAAIRIVQRAKDRVK